MRDVILVPSYVQWNQELNYQNSYWGKNKNISSRQNYKYVNTEELCQMVYEMWKTSKYTTFIVKKQMYIKDYRQLWFSRLRVMLRVEVGVTTMRKYAYDVLQIKQ